MKICKTCKNLKEEIQFPKGRKSCKECRRIYNKQWREKNKNTLKEKGKIYKEKNKEIITRNWKKYYYEDGGREKKKEYDEKYYMENRERKLVNMKNYVQENKKKITNYKRLWKKDKRHNDIIYKLRDLVSITNGFYLRKGSNSKKSSILKCLPYTIQQLKEHLEKQFEPWMNWKNHGAYEEGKQTWQIDHIIPQSKLPYDSMEHENFQKCWALENLRPLDSLENIKKGNR